MKSGRHDLLVALLAAGLSTTPACGNKTAPPKPKSTSKATAPAATTADPLPTLADLRGALEIRNTSASLAALERLLAAGASLDLLRDAILAASAELAAPPIEVEVRAALWRLERKVAPARRLEALLHLAARHRRTLTAFGKAKAPAKPDVALRRLDEQGLQEALDRAIDKGDAVGVSAALRVTLEEDGQEALGNALVRVLTVDDGHDGERTAAAMAAFRLLDTRGYQDHGATLDQIAAWTTPAPEPARARAKTLRLLAREVNEAFERGVPEASRRELVRKTALEKGGGSTLVELLRSSLAEAIAPSSLWDGLILAAVDRNEPDGRALRLMHALRMLGERSPAPSMRALCLLAAAERFPAAGPTAAVNAAGAATSTGDAAADSAAGDAAKAPDEGAIRLAWLERDAGDGGALVGTVALLEAAAMADPEVQERSRVRQALMARLRPPPATAKMLAEREAHLALIARLRAPKQGPGH